MEINLSDELYKKYTEYFVKEKISIDNIINKALKEKNKKKETELEEPN